MKKILLAFASILCAVSCNWDGGNSGDPLQIKFVQKLTFADGSYATFLYKDLTVTNIDFSNGDYYTFDYDNENSYNWSIIVSSNKWNEDLVLKVENSFLKKSYIGSRQITDFEYGEQFNYNLTSLVNYAELMTTSLTWQGVYGSYMLPYRQTTKWYEGMIEDRNVVKTQQLSYLQWDPSGVNFYAYMNFMPLVVPEYTECSGIDNVILAAVGGLRTYYLPSSIKIEVSQGASIDEEGNTSEIVRNYKYDVDNDGYITAIYSGEESNLTRLLTIEYGSSYEPSK